MLMSNYLNFITRFFIYAAAVVFFWHLLRCGFLMTVQKKSLRETSYSTIRVNSGVLDLVMILLE